MDSDFIRAHKTPTSSNPLLPILKTQLSVNTLQLILKLEILARIKMVSFLKVLNTIHKLITPLWSNHEMGELKTLYSWPLIQCGSHMTMLLMKPTSPGHTFNQQVRQKELSTMEMERLSLYPYHKWSQMALESMSLTSMIIWLWSQTSLYLLMEAFLSLMTIILSWKL